MGVFRSLESRFATVGSVSTIRKNVKPSYLAIQMVIAGLLVFASGCQTQSNFLANQSARPKSMAMCFQDRADSLRIIGLTNKDMFSCVEATLTASISEVVITSDGGSPEYGMKIADALAPLDIDLVVEGRCASSCANYIVPIAKNVKVNEHSLIMLHGSIDPVFVRNIVNINNEDFGYIQSLSKKQRHFMELHAVPKGWVLWREEDTNAMSDFVGVKGAFAGFPESDAANRRQLLVDERFFKSCFPNKSTNFHKNSAAVRAVNDEVYAKELAAAGYFPSGEAVCDAPREDKNIHGIEVVDITEE